MRLVSLRVRIDVSGGQPPSSLCVDSPGGYIAKKDRGARFQTPLRNIAKLSHLARPSALWLVPRPQHQAILVNNWVSYLAIYALAEGTNLFWSKRVHGA